MPSRLVLTVLLFLTLAPNLRAQVDEIKKKSEENANSPKKSSGQTTETTASEGDGLGFFNLLVDGFVLFGAAQVAQLERRRAEEHLVSLEAHSQAALQPPAYYIVMPRLRANWGLFSSDARFNVLLEQSTRSFKAFRSFDWQLLQLNLVNREPVTFRVGIGYLQELDGGEGLFPEYTFGLDLRLKDNQWRGGGELRVASDGQTEIVPRLETSGRVQYRLFEGAGLAGYATGGLTFQRYYESLNVWGVVTGLSLVVK